MSSFKLINFRITEEEDRAWQKFADEYVNGNKSRLIRRAVEIVMRNPSLLDPTQETVRLLTDLQEAYREETEWKEAVEIGFHQLDKRIGAIEAALSKKLDLVLKTQGVSKKKIKEELEGEEMEDIIFEDE